MIYLEKFQDKKDIVKSFYLIGDAGYAQPGQSTPALIALEKYLNENKQKGNYAIFLGDNIYPDGMPKKDAKDRALAEHRLDVQIDAAKDFDGKVIFIPGNHDWYNEGLKGLSREEKYFETKLKDKKAFKPTKGCPLESIDVTEDIQLLIVDSQWYLEDWDKHPTINDDCPEIKTREALLQEIESEFKKNQNKTVVVALHHPLYTNGIHGGKFAPSKHLYPSQKKIPLPVLASLGVIIRTSGGVSIQDKMNKQYKEFANRVSTLAQAARGKIIFVSGHEHSLQYIEHEGVKQIVSGSGAKNSYAALRNDGLFAYGGQGFVRLDIHKDGSSVASFFGVDNKEPKLLYKAEVYPKTEEYDTSGLPKITEAYIDASVYEYEETDKSAVYESIWGDHYRDLYGQKVKTKVAMLDTLYGGLEVVRAGGGNQTRSLRLKDKNGKEYNMRALKKSGVQFIQNTFFKDNYVEKSLENTISEDILQDFYTAAHPYIFMVVPHLSEAIGVYHTNPKLYYVPKQPALGKYNVDYGDELYMIVERPEKNHGDLASFGKPDDIESTTDLYERLRRDEKYRLDEPSYIRARLFDMLIGDWDRHEDQWRWAEFELENGDHLFKPIPRDRDQAFSNFDGALLGTLRGLVGASKQLQRYDDNLNDIKWLNLPALSLDRTLIQSSDEKEWIKQANHITENLTDDVIEEAFSKLPPEAKGDDAKNIIKNLKSRRDNLAIVAKKYYEYLANLAVVTGTDKDDYFEITRLAKGTTKITVYRIKDGEKADVVSTKEYHKKNTKEIWIYGLDDDDVFKVTGVPKDPIRIKIIGGQNNDIYDIEKGRAITVYDHKSKPNTIKQKGRAKFVFTDDYDVNHYDKFQNKYSSNAIIPAFGFNPDDGFRLGLMNTYTYYGFHRNPFTQQHQFRGGYYFATNSFDLEYEGTFAGIFENYNLFLGGRVTSPSFAVNFFGLGNESVNEDDDRGLNYNRVRLSTYEAEIGAVKSGRFGSYFGYKASIEGVQVDNTNDRFITEQTGFTANDRVFERIWFLGIDGTYSYESYDVPVNPTLGMKFELQTGAKMNTDETERTFGYVNTNLGFYNSLIRSRKLVLRTEALAQFNIGRNYEFYQAAQIGGENLLRGYRTQRFSGQTALAGSVDLRYSFNQFKTKFLPLQFGIFTGVDTGRVWVKGDGSKKWHSDYGGGFWFNSADAIQGTFNLFAGEDGLRFSFGFGFKF